MDKEPDDPECDRARALLEAFRHNSRKSRQELDHAMGEGRGFTSQVLTARVNLRLAHIVQLLAAIGVAPGLFFALLYPATEEDRLALPGMLRTLQTLGVEGFAPAETAAPAAPPLLLEDVARVIREEVEKAFVAHFPPAKRQPREGGF